MIDYISDNISEQTYEVLAELAVIYATKMDKTYKELFFQKTKDKFMKELKYLKEETLYKILWACIKSGELTVSEHSSEWQGVKQIIISRSKELSPKVFSDILVLSTLESKQETGQKAADLFSSVEADLIMSMKVMALDDLLNLMWSALEIDRGSQFFYQTLEAELSKRVRGIKDEQFETLIGCFLGEKADLSMNVFS
jgi:hypothetical protein